MFFRPCFFHPFLGALFQDLDGFGRFRGPPKSTLALQNDSFYDGASTIRNKSCFLNKKNDVQKNMCFLSLLDLQKPPQIRLWASKSSSWHPSGLPRFAQDAPKAPRTLPRPPKRPLWHRFWMLRASVLEDPGHIFRTIFRACSLFYCSCFVSYCIALLHLAVFVFTCAGSLLKQKTKL